MQSPTGSRNVCWRREPPGGNTEEPEADNLRVSAEKAEREKLNDERGVKPLPVSRSRDGAECGHGCSGWVEGSFCILALEISAPVALETMTGREPRTCLTVLDECVLTHVTAVAKSQINRATSVAAGVVSGAGWCQPVIQTPHSDESASSRTRQSLDPIAFGVKADGGVSLQQGS